MQTLIQQQSFKQDFTFALHPIGPPQNQIQIDDPNPYYSSQGIQNKSQPGKYDIKLQSSESFQQRFKGKTQLINKDGHFGVVQTGGAPIHKVPAKEIQPVQKEKETILIRKTIFPESAYQHPENFYSAEVANCRDRFQDQTLQKGNNQHKKSETQSSLQASYFKNFQIFKQDVYLPEKYPGLDSILAQKAVLNSSHEKRQNLTLMKTGAMLMSRGAHSDKMETGSRQSQFNKQSRDFTSSLAVQQGRNGEMSKLQYQSIRSGDSQVYQWPTHKSQSASDITSNSSFLGKESFFYSDPKKQTGSITGDGQLKSSQSINRQRFLKRIDIQQINSLQAESIKKSKENNESQKAYQDQNQLAFPIQIQKRLRVSSQLQASNSLGSYKRTQVGHQNQRYSNQNPKTGPFNSEPKFIEVTNKLDVIEVDHDNLEIENYIKITGPEIQDRIFKHQMENKPNRFKEHTILKPGKYYKLGGLGPSNIGSDEWIVAKQKRSNMSRFAAQVKISKVKEQSSSNSIQPDSSYSVKRFNSVDNIKQLYQGTQFNNQRIIGNP